MKVALFAEIVPDPRTVVPSRKDTLPVAFAGTVAVKVTEVPKMEGFAELARLVVLAAWLTTWVKGALVLL